MSKQTQNKYLRQRLTEVRGLQAVVATKIFEEKLPSPRRTYMVGLYNGMEIALARADGRDQNLLDQENPYGHA